MIKLSPELLLGEGRDRLCFRHPDDACLCIKVAKKTEKQTRREKRYFTYLMANPAKDCSQLSCYRGDVQTDQGIGALFDRVTNADGSDCLTLRQAIEAGQLSRAEVIELTQQFKTYLWNNAICVRDISTNNLMVRHDQNQQKQLLMIDGVSNPGVNPLTIYWPWLARHYLQKSWHSLEQKIERAFSTLETRDSASR